MMFGTIHSLTNRGEKYELSRIGGIQLMQLISKKVIMLGSIIRFVGRLCLSLRSVGKLTRRLS